jgi:hypothetical protein
VTWLTAGAGAGQLASAVSAWTAPARHAAAVDVSQIIGWRPQQDSNLRTRLRRAVLYPLSYGGWRCLARKALQAGPEQEYQ